MTERDELLAETTVRASQIERAARLAAEDYSGPRRPRAIPAGPILGGHGESVPLPSVSGGSGQPPAVRPVAAGLPDPDYRGGAMVPIEYVLAEGSELSGRAMVHHVLYRAGHRAREAGLEVVRDTAPDHPEPPEPPEPADEPTPDDTALLPAVAALTDDVAYGLGSLAVVLWIGAALLLAGVVWL